LGYAGGREEQINGNSLLRGRAIRGVGGLGAITSKITKRSDKNEQKLRPEIVRGGGGQQGCVEIGDLGRGRGGSKKGGRSSPERRFGWPVS